MPEEETKKVNTEAVPSLGSAPDAPVPEQEVTAVGVCKDETEEKYVVIEERSIEEAAKPAAAPETKKSGRFFRLWSKGKKKETQSLEPAAVPEPAAVAEPEAPVVEEPKEEIKEKLVVEATETKEKPEDTTTLAVADSKKSAHFFKLPSFSWKKGPKKTETVDTPATPVALVAEPEPPVVAEAPKDEIVEKSVIVPGSEEKTEDPKPDVEADVAPRKSGGFFKLGSIKWRKTKKKESSESLPSVPVEESDAKVAEPLKVEADEKSIVPVEEEKVDDSKPVVVNDDIILTKAANEKTLALIQAWEESEKAKIENKAEKSLSVILSAENSKKAAVEAELKKIEEKLEKLKNKEALIHKEAEEKRAAVEAIRNEELLTAEETAALYRATGSVPKKLPLLGYL